MNAQTCDKNLSEPENARALMPLPKPAQPVTTRKSGCVKSHLLGSRLALVPTRPGGDLVVGLSTLSQAPVTGSVALLCVETIAPDPDTSRKDQEGAAIHVPFRGTFLARPALSTAGHWSARPGQTHILTHRRLAIASTRERGDGSPWPSRSGRPLESYPNPAFFPSESHLFGFCSHPSHRHPILALVGVVHSNPTRIPPFTYPRLLQLSVDLCDRVCIHPVMWTCLTTKRQERQA